MPIGAYFKGHGREVLKKMKGNKREFYATAAKQGMKPVSHGSMTMPKDIGAARQAEGEKVGGRFKKGGADVRASSYF